MKSLLYPLSLLYSLITSVRNSLYDLGIFSIYSSALPVVSVGNLTAGGNGKTPLVILLCSLFSEGGKRPVVLSRGYGGKIKGPHCVDLEDRVEEVGDEPLMLSNRLQDLPVVIAKDRVLGAKYIEDNDLGDLIILDDGFQHRRLGRSLDIICINVSSEDARRQFFKGRLLPFGLFREERHRGLARADCIVLSTRQLVGKIDRESLDRFKESLDTALPTYIAELDNLSVRDSESGEELEKGEVFLFSTIANPEGFHQTVKEGGFNIRGSKVFGDHYYLSSEDLQELRTESEGVPLVCTEKDLIKIPVEERHGIYVAEVSTALDDQAGFVKLLNTFI